MEYLLVKFSEDRECSVDGKIQGMTNETIELEKGTHLVSLKSPPNDFQPNRRKIKLENTSSISPMEVSFEKNPG